MLRPWRSWMRLEDDVGAFFAVRRDDARARAAREPAVCGRSETRSLSGDAVVLAPDVEPLLEELRRDLGLHEVLELRRALAHRLRRRGATGERHERRVGARAADERLRRAVRRLEQAELPLQPREREHAVLASAVANSSPARPSIWWPP